MAEVAKQEEVSPTTVRRWIRKGRLKATRVSGRYSIPREENIEFFVERIRNRWRQPRGPWIPRNLARYADWHTVIDELVWLIKVTYTDRAALKRRRFRLDHIFQRHLDENVRTLDTLLPALVSSASAAPATLAEDLRRGWYNELAFTHPLRPATLGLGFGDVELNKEVSADRLTFPSWRFIQAYYAVYFYVRCLSQMKVSSFRKSQHAATINTFKHSVLPVCEGAVWPWPLGIRHAPGRRVRRASLPIGRLPHLQFGYARHPRPPHRTPLESYEFVRAAFRKLAARRKPSTVYTLVDFLYDFRVWANYQDIDTLMALWGPGYRSFIDMNLSVLVFFIGGCVELAFAASQGAPKYSAELQRFYDRFIARDDALRGDFPSSPLYQRSQIFSGRQLIDSGLNLRSEENPHRVEVLRAKVV